MAAKEGSSYSHVPVPVKIVMNKFNEPSSDEQELFLKVLENLKNAVGKPDHSGSQPQTLTRSDNDEPGTTTVTVSDKTKSLILQKLAFERTGIIRESNLNQTKKQTVDLLKQINFTPINPPVATSLDRLKQTRIVSSGDQGSGNSVVVSYVSYENLSSEPNQRNVIIAKPTTGFEAIGNTVTKSVVTQTKLVTNPTGSQRTPSVQLYPCDFCDYYSDNKNYLKQHLVLVHTTDRPYKCPYCDYAGKRSHALREHLIVHTDERPFQCQICKATFRKKGHLTNHVKLHNSKRLVKCPLCKILVYDVGENGLDAHLKNDHDTERLFGCDLCDHVAATEPDILKHLSQKHKSKLVTHKCDKCPFETANAVDFQSHATAHNMSASTVQVGSKAGTKILGVATVPKEKLQSLPPNTTVRFSDSGKKGDGLEKDSSPMSAVMKPVWIKCSVCGFTEQDSEKIKTHMLEHLKDQYGKNYVEKLRSEPEYSTSSSSATPTPTIPAKPVTPVITQALPAKPTIPPPKAPILVPVTNVEQLLPQHAGKIDMNSPVLVPVTDPSFLKSLKTQTGLIATKLPPFNTDTKLTSIPVNKMEELMHSGIEARKPIASSGINTASSGINTVVTNIMKPSAISVTSVLKPSTPIISATTPTPTVSSNQNVQVIPSPSSLHQAVNVSLQSLPTPIITSSSPSSILSTASPAASGLPPVLTKIPVPRSIAVPEISKLSQEIISSLAGSLHGDNKAGLNDDVDGATELKLASLKENLANVQKLIQEQDKINRQAGNPSIIRLDAQGIPEKININGVVYYIDSTQKKNTVINMPESFTHDVTAGRFKCTLCGYTCEYQRTIKAHIWKHSGNKNIDYPMFQNGPLSVYEDESLPVRQETTVEGKSVIVKPEQTVSLQKIQSVPITEAAASSSKLPSFIVYEQSKISNMAPLLANFISAKKAFPDETDSDNVDIKPSDIELDDKISNVAPALANLIAARTMAGIKDVKDEDTQQSEQYQPDDMPESLDDGQLTIDESETCSETTVTTVSDKQSVVVEIVDSLANPDGYTAIQSQQNSPRIATKSPDSGLCESGSMNEEVPKVDQVLEHGATGTTKRSTRKRPKSTDDITTAPLDKKAKLEEAREDSAVTLLSLLKKGPNYNPACPTVVKNTAPVIQYSNVSSPGKDDSNSVGDSDAGSGKPKSGISTSLLAVIEQLRERSKSDVDEEKPLAPPSKKQYRRRSRKSSLEDNTPASGIENVEEFYKGEEVKYRCKLCHYTNDSTLLLRQHMKLHKPKQEFECSLCDLIAESSEALQDHMIQHCKVRTYQCKLCTSAFSYKSQLRAHMRMHNDQDILMCDLCDYETRNVTMFRLHVMSHSMKQYKCDACNKEFDTIQTLNQHKREECDKNLGYACSDCDFVGVGRRELKNHQKTHISKKCPYCDHSEATLEMIRKHISVVHGESKPLKCEMCGFYAVSIRSLKSHMKRHINDQRFVAQPLEQYKCNLCGYVCHHLPSLKSHMWRHAADEHYSYEFTNDIINAAIDFDSLTDLPETTKTHVERFRLLIIEKMKAKGLEHTRDTLEESAKACCWVTFRCCQCGFETINKAELNKHMTAHTDIIKKTLEVAETVAGSAESETQSQDESMSP